MWQITSADVLHSVGVPDAHTSASCAMNPERPPVSPQLALRVALLGGLCLVLFSMMFFRLWSLQILSSEQFVVEARENRTRDIRIQAPRGEILDRNGRVLVTNRSAVVVELEVAELPEAERDAAAAWGQRSGRRRRPLAIPPIPEQGLRDRFERLGRVLDMRPRTIHRRVIEQLAVLPYANVLLRDDVPLAVAGYLLERQDAYPGVRIQQRYLRRYPRGELAAQLVGYVGEISPAELKQRRNRGVTQGTIVGKAGIEYSYDRYLRGRDGASKLQVDANGDPKGELRRRQEPVPGRPVRLSLDLGLQRAGQQALQTVGGDRPGAFVAMNPQSGAVYGMGSYPSFDPSVFAKPISARVYDRLNSEENGAPLFNRATGGFYPTGSTFKPLTAIAGLRTGTITDSTTVVDTGCIQVGDAERCNAGEQPYGTVDLRRALQVSSDVYFYRLGMDLNPLDGQPLQTWARRLGLGRRTGIDLPAEGRGLIPDRRWRAEVADRERRCRRRNDGEPCGISDMRPWSVGDEVNLAIGQGDMQASPLQMAVAYSALANRGRVVRPHLGMEVLDPAGRTVQRLEPGSTRRVEIPAAEREAILDGLAAAAQRAGGTSVDVFADWPHDQYPVFGKTGTAQRPPKADQSWYVAYVPHRTKPIVVAVTVEEGGFGAETAAPITRLILSQWFGIEKKVVKGRSATR